MFLCNRKTAYYFVGSLIILSAVLLTVVRIGIQRYTSPQTIHAFIQQKSPYPIAVENITVDWHGLTPNVHLSQVEITPVTGNPIAIGELQLRLNVWALLRRQVQLKSLEVHGADLAIEETADGVFQITNLPELRWDSHQALQASTNITLPALSHWHVADLRLHLTRINGDQLAAKVDSLSGHLSGLLGMAFQCHIDLTQVAIEGYQAETQREWNIPNFKGTLDIKKSAGTSSPTVNLSFKEITLASPTTQSMLSPLTGSFHLEGHQGSLTINSPTLTIQEPRLFLEAFSLHRCHMALEFNQSEEGWTLLGKSVKAQYAGVPIEAEFNAEFSPDKAKPTVDAYVHIDPIELSQAKSLLPKAWMNPALVQWLDTALVSGKAQSTAMVLRGDLQDFPFDHHEGVFEVYSELDNVHLQYDHHWPALEGLKANMLFRNRSMRIEGDYARLEGGIVEDLDALIPDMTIKSPHLIIDTKVKSTLERGKAVLANSPLQDKLGSQLAPLTLEGPMDLSLGLEIPLGKVPDGTVKVRGLVDINAGLFSCLKGEIAIDQIKGEVQFSESHLLANGLKGQFLGSESAFDLSGQFNATGSTMHIGAQGTLDPHHITEWQQMPRLPFLQGQSAYRATLDFSPQDKEQYHLTVHSDLQGIMLDAPVPFAKAANDTRPLKVDMYFEPKDVVRFSAQYGDTVSLTYSLQRGSKPRTLGGHLYIGEKQHAKFREDGIFLLDGEIKEVNFDVWKHFFNEWQQSMGQSMNKSYAVDPLLALEVEQLTINALPFHQTKVEAEWQDDQQRWNIQLAGPAISGMILLAKDKQKPLEIRLQKLVLNTKDTPSLTEGPQKPLPPLEQVVDATITECTINDISLSAVALKLSGIPHGYHFDHFSASMQGGDLNLTGSWDVQGESSSVAMKGKFKVNNMTDVFNTLNRTHSINKAKGLVDFNLSWKGVPFKCDYPSLKGVVDMRLEKGSIRGMNPGLGRILNLLNLDNMTKRLNLDFSDLTHNGFVFNALTGRFQFGNGKVSSNDIMINGPSAKILAYGQADILTQAVRGEVTVMPNLIASLPITAALAVGSPMLGAAVWVFDKMVGDKLQEVQRFRYQVAGTWQSPQLEELEYSLHPYTLLE